MKLKRLNFLLPSRSQIPSSLPQALLCVRIPIVSFLDLLQSWFQPKMLVFPAMEKLTEPEMHLSVRLDPSETPQTTGFSLFGDVKNYKETLQFHIASVIHCFCSISILTLAHMNCYATLSHMRERSGFMASQVHCLPSRHWLYISYHQRFTEVSIGSTN